MQPSRKVRWVRWLLRRLLPAGTGRAVLADLERELSERRARGESQRRDAFWLLLEGTRVALRMRVGRAAGRVGGGQGRRGGTRWRDGRGWLGPGIGLLSDLVAAFRSLRRSPLLVTTAAGVLAFGVAAPTIMFSLVRAIGADLPVPDPDALVHVGFTNARLSPFVRTLPGGAMRVVHGNPPSTGPVSAYAAGLVDLTGGGDPERLTAGWISVDLFDVLNTAPLIGRAFTAADARPDAPPVVLLGERLWRERFGADADILGSVVRVNRTPATVVGIVPAPLRMPSGAEVWLPVAPGAATDDTRAYHGIARLPSGPRREAALQEVAALVERGLSADVEAAGDDPRPMVRPYREHMIDADARSILATMLALAGLVLLIACANVANLLLSRAVSRRRELAVRVALGASRLRVAWHQLAESAAVAVLGGLAGCLLAVVGIALARRALGHELAWWMELRLDGEVLAFAAALIGVAALLAGLLPALHAMRSDPDSELRGGARGGGDGPGLSRLSKGLVVAEVGFSAAVLIVSALMARGAFSHSFEDETREPEAVMVVAYTLPAEPADARARLEFHHTLTDRLGARPGVESVALAGVLPGVPGPRWLVEVPGSADLDEPRSTHVVRVSPGYFEALGAAIMRGRDLTWRDGEEDPPAVVVNEAFVRRHLPQGDPLGRTIRILPPAVDEAVEAVVVGVAPQMGIVDRSDAWEDALYLPPAVSPSRGAYVLTRARAGLDPHTLLPDIREVVRGLDPDRPLYDVATLAEHQRSERITEWFFTGFFGAFGLAGLLMAGAGLYAVIAFAVGRRRREVGVRVALGASPRRVLWTVGRGAGIQLGAGLVLGLGLAAVVAPAFGEALLGADPHDLVVYTLVAALIGATGLLASAVPAARALRVRPAEALRAE